MNKLGVLLANKGFKPEHLAFACGLDTSTVIEIINRDDLKGINKNLIEKFAKELRVDSSEFYEDVDYVVSVSYEGYDIIKEIINFKFSTIKDIYIYILEKLDLKNNLDFYKYEYPILVITIYIASADTGEMISEKLSVVIDLEQVYDIEQLIEQSKKIYLDSSKSRIERLRDDLRDYMEEYRIKLDISDSFMYFDEEWREYDPETHTYYGDFVFYGDIDTSYEYDEFEPEEMDEVIHNARKKFDKFKGRLIHTLEDEKKSIISPFVK